MRSWSTAPTRSSRPRPTRASARWSPRRRRRSTGSPRQFPTPERHHPYANDTLYGAAKTFNEGLLRSFHAMRGLDYVALRYFNVYGPRMDIYGLYTEVLIRWMERIEAGQPPLILGDGTQTMDFVFTEDIARANLLAARVDATDEVFNIGSGTETSLRRARAGAAARDGQRPAAGVRAAARRQRGDPAPGRRLAGRRTPRLEGRGRPGRRPAAAGHMVAGASGADRRTVASMTIPVMRPWLGAEEAAAAAAAVSSGWVAQGPRVAEFEEAFAAAIGAGHAVAVSSCTTALHLALVVAAVGPGDEVVVPSLSFIATANAARYVGAQPVFADVDAATQNLTPATVEPHADRSHPRRDPRRPGRRPGRS